MYGVMKGKQGVGTVFATRMGINFFAFAFPFFGKSADGDTTWLDILTFLIP